MFSWEQKIKERVSEKRETELRYIRKSSRLQLVNIIANAMIPILTMLVTYGSYTLGFKQELKGNVDIVVHV